MTNHSHRFQEQDYIPAIGALGEKRLFAANHICIHSDCTIFNDVIIPFGGKDILEKGTAAIDEILHEIIHVLQKVENRERKIIICGEEKVKKMFVRKLEDRLKRDIE